MHTSFRSASLPEAERVAAYGELVGGTGRMTPLSQPFQAEFEAYVVGPMRFHDVRAVPHLFERSAAKIAMDGLGVVMIQHLVQGRAEIETQGRVIEAAEGSVFAVSLAQPLAIREIGDVHLRLLTMSRRVGEEGLGDLSTLHGHVLSPEAAAPYADHFTTLWPRLNSLPAVEAPEVVRATLAVLAGVFDRKVAGRAASGAGTTPERARAYVEQHLRSRALTPSSMRAALGLSQLGKLERFKQRRAALAAAYDAALADLAPVVRRVSAKADEAPCLHLHQVLVDWTAAGVTRAEVMRRMAAAGVGTQVHYAPVYRQPYMRRRYGPMRLTGAEAFYARVLALPLFPGMADSDVERAVAALKAAMGL